MDFILNQLVTAINVWNFTPITTIICITVLYFPYSTLATYFMEYKVHLCPLIRPRKILYVRVKALPRVLYEK